MEQSSNLFIIIITIMQVLSRVASDCPVNETLDILHDNPLLEKYRSVCEYLRNVTFPTLDESSFNKSQAYCVKEFERHHSDLTDFINRSCSYYFMGTTSPEVELPKTSTISPSTALAIDETDNSTTKSTTIIHSLSTGNMSDVRASTKEYLLSTSISVVKDNSTTVSTTIIRDFAIGNKSDISESTLWTLPSSSPMAIFKNNYTVEATTDTSDFSTLNVRNMSVTKFADNLTIVSTKVVNNFTTGNESDFDSAKTPLMSTLMTEFADKSTTVSTIVVDNFTTGNESDISDSTKRPLLNSLMTKFADYRTTVSTTVVNNFTTGNESDISDSTKRPLLITSMTAFADNRTTVSTTVVNNVTTGDESDIIDSSKRPLLSTSMTEFADNSTTVSTKVVNTFTTGNESDISDSTKRSLLSTSMTEFADKSTTVSTTVVKNLTTGNESDISDSTKRPLLNTPMTGFAANLTTESTALINNFTTGNGSDMSTIGPLLRVSLLTFSNDYTAISTLVNVDLTTDKSDESDGKKVLLTSTRPSTLSNFSELNSTIIRSETSTTTVMTTLGKKIETTTAKVIKPRTRTKQKITPKEAGISTTYALLLFFTAVTLGIIVIVTVLIVYKKFRTGSYEPEAGLRDTSLELEDSL